MSKLKRVVGLACGFTAAGALGLAIAQSNPPNNRAPDASIGAGQQSTFHTGMGETGLPPWSRPIPTAVISILPRPEPVAVAPAPESVAAAPEPAPTTTMGAPPEEKPARTDRN
ncbi:hypothetical protein GCM10027034_23050 [Ramlibacter solisilvae]|uniref:Uncharacterized protein n=1 Tax=Ramlibacter tataouinensis TaxID=94132 RepID=A0A127JVH5_9BURK|nr:hypothetical protein [Ramlibacter tataouinensis]AMO22022.1 hypothetical protein UC35_02945 [Ramlibacter tataouinensis]